MLAAQARSKKLVDTDDEKPITDLFLAKAGVEAIRQITIMAAPSVLESMNFKDIQKVIMSHLQPTKRLVVAERSNFMAILQNEGESVRAYAHRLREGARYCSFEELGSARSNQSAEDELIQMRLIAGLNNSGHKIKLLEYIQSTRDNVTLNSCVEFALQLELIGVFNQKAFPDASQMVGQQAALVAQVDKYKTKEVAKCIYCGRNHMRGQCPAFGKKCKKCGKSNHFAVVCRSKFDMSNAHHLEEHDVKEQRDVFSVGKALLKNVKLDGVAVPMQLDSGSQATIIPSNLWERLGRPRLSKTCLRLKQFDGTALRTLGQYTAAIEMDDKFVTGTIVVATCVKDHGLLGTNVLKVDFENMSINNVNKSIIETYTLSLIV